ncbi:DNA primase family protein [Buttiauxella izardii]|uniref:DNA primase n=1 Tax=Buttiauxella izardii TaxID=82991 RepID=A0A3A5K506_9ENTR|nr:primase-like DNA-binding domain-containing protein [Buttiauxella izardii]RJT27689.1 DNA primase [Buttiauxella izardii]
MNNAPNVKCLPKDKLTEAIIFAGADAYSHMQHWTDSEGTKAGDSVPPVWIGPKQLSELDNLRIIDDGRRYARVYRAGALSESQVTVIATKLALAGVTEARLFNGIGEQKPAEDWTPQLPRLKADAENGHSLVVKVPRGDINLIQMADNEKALLLASRYKGIAIHAESEAVYLYRAGVWEKAAPLELSREMVAIYNENQTNFGKRTINNVIEALKIVIPVMGLPRRNLIPFANGVYDMETGEFSEHDTANWLTNHNGVEYTPAVPGENLHDHAPNFHKWLSYASGKEALKMQRIAAGLFMVLANRFDWQLFLEITGVGGSGKSVFTHIATMLAGQHNTASGNMAALDSARGRAQFVGKSMITLPDQPKYSGEGTGIKAITGGDAVEIDPKHEHQYTAVLRAVVIATNNTPMVFTERAEGVARRRVIFQFNNRVSDVDKDPLLPEKIAAEIPVIIRRLLANFSNPDDAKRLLLEQRNSEEALEVKQKTDPLYAFCSHLKKLNECTGMLVGNRNPPFFPRAYVYHAYLSFLEANGFDRPLTLNKFAEGMESAMREFSHEYRKERKTRGIVTNVELSNSAEDWLPQSHHKQ